MSDHRNRFTIEMMCRVFRVSKSSYYQWIRNGPSDRWKENESLLVDILDIFENSRETYGSPRITEELRAQNRTVSRKRVAKIMQAAPVFLTFFTSNI